MLESFKYDISDSTILMNRLNMIFTVEESYIINFIIEKDFKKDDFSYNSMQCLNQKLIFCIYNRIFILSNNDIVMHNLLTYYLLKKVRFEILFHKQN